MKLPELKNRLRNKYVVRVAAGVLTIALVGSGVGTYTVKAAKNDTAQSTETTETVEAVESDDLLDEDILSNVNISAKSVDKEETVYLLSDANGNVNETIVVDHLFNRDNKSTLDDSSSLSDIENVKGNEEFTQNGNSLTWQADGKDIYYQGTSNEKAPVSQSVTYYLDGKEIAPKDLAGKSGKVTIHFDYTNNTSFTEKVNGEEVTVSVPFAAITALMLDDSFSNVEVTNGEIKENNGSNIVIGYALPGLSDSLGLDSSDLVDNVTIPEYFEVTADVENFSLSTAMTFVVNASNYVDSEGASLDTVEDLLDGITDATGKLQDGSAELADGADTLADGAKELESGAGKLSDGAVTLRDGIGTLKSGLTDYTEGASKINTGAATLAAGVQTLNDKVPALATGVNTIADSTASINTGIQALDAGLNTALTNEEKTAYMTQASEQAVAKVDASFADATNPMNYDNIKATASSQFTATMTSDASVAALVSNLSSNTDFYNMVYATVESQVRSKLEGAIYASAKVSVDGVMASTPGMLQADAIKMCYNNSSLLRAGVADNLGLSDVPADYDALVTMLTQANTQSQLNTIATSIMQGIAANGAEAMGTSVADNVKTAAETAASEAAGAALVTGIEMTKANVASQIEATQANGYSLVTGTAALNEGVQTLKGSVPALTSGITALVNGANELSKGTATLTSNNPALLSGIQQLSTGSGTLADGAKTLAEGTTKLSDGAGTLAEGSHTLADGIVEFNEKGIKKIVDAYEGDIKPLANKLQATIDAGADYQTYSGLADGSTGSVKFVYKLQSIEANDAE